MAGYQEELDKDEELLPVFKETIYKLIETLIKPECFKRDLCFAVLLVLMRENDFQLLKGIGIGTIAIVDYVVSMRRLNSDTYEAQFIYKEYESLPVKLVVSHMSDIMLINAIIPQINQRTYSLCLPINKFFIWSQLALPRCFTNLQELCSTFKDKIMTPVKSSILNYNRMPSGSLAGLPSEVLRLILVSLPVKDVLNLSESCKRINGIVSEDCLWFHLYSRDFPGKCKSQGSFRDMYKEEFVNKKGEVQAMRNSDNVTQVEMSGYMMYSCIPDPRWEVLL